MRQNTDTKPGDVASLKTEVVELEAREKAVCDEIQQLTDECVQIGCGYLFR